MAEWNLRYENEIKIPKKEQNYFWETFCDFVELTYQEKINLNKILKERGVYNVYNS